MKGLEGYGILSMAVTKRLLVKDWLEKEELETVLKRMNV